MAKFIELEEKIHLTEIGEGIESLVINSKVGSIVTTRSKTDNIEIEVVKKIRTEKELGPEEESELLDSLELVTRIYEEKLFLSTNLKKIYENQGNIDLLVGLPEGVKDINISMSIGDLKTKDCSGNYSVDLDMGNIKLENIRGQLKLHTEVGDIKLARVDLVGENYLDSNIGEIKAYVDSIENTGSLNAEVGVGKLKFRIPEGNYRINTKGLMKEKSEESQIPTINLRTNLGKLDFKYS